MLVIHELYASPPTNVTPNDCGIAIDNFLVQNSSGVFFARKKRLRSFVNDTTRSYTMSYARDTIGAQLESYRRRMTAVLFFPFIIARGYFYHAKQSRVKKNGEMLARALARTRR